jgi:membrane protease YdiL (CAAX protease family)
MTILKRHPLVVFFVLAYLFSWLIWGTTIAQSRSLLSFHIPSALVFWIGLNLATYITAALTGGWAAVKDVLSRIVRWRFHPVWYLIALLLTAAISLASIAIHRALGGSHQVGVLLAADKILPSLLFQIFFFTLTEETAWRGFALPRLQVKYNALTSSLILGLLWGLWHFPLTLIPGTFQATTPFAGFVLSTIATAILMTWLFNHSRGSVLLAGIFHAATDVAIPFLNVMTGDLRLFWMFIAIQWVVAGIIILREGAAYLSREKNLPEVSYPASSSEMALQP